MGHRGVLVVGKWGSCELATFFRFVRRRERVCLFIDCHTPHARKIRFAGRTSLVLCFFHATWLLIDNRVLKRAWGGSYFEAQTAPERSNGYWRV